MSFKITLANQMVLNIESLNLVKLLRAIENHKTFKTPKGFIINGGMVVSIEEFTEKPVVKKPVVKKPVVKKPVVKKPVVKKGIK